ncbi:hypothetical protein BVRB_6g140230 [Beta vulgaris subsp. vulgaris]|uniref:Uncharacterized protein n=1 Tax=Beta vulgaris subsp. vulgaris TaxID=3555 RepID=A0A0J8C8Z0_BETVV|nr:hypothetical protein BVRB_6g140230 [Beta vulgaris subsp. vulgaris]
MNRYNDRMTRRRRTQRNRYSRTDDEATKNAEEGVRGTATERTTTRRRRQREEFEEPTIHVKERRSDETRRFPTKVEEN